MAKESGAALQHSQTMESQDSLNFDEPQRTKHANPSANPLVGDGLNRMILIYSIYCVHLRMIDGSLSVKTGSPNSIAIWYISSCRWSILPSEPSFRMNLCSYKNSSSSILPSSRFSMRLWLLLIMQSFLSSRLPDITMTLLVSWLTSTALLCLPFINFRSVSLKYSEIPKFYSISWQYSGSIPV